MSGWIKLRETRTFRVKWWQFRKRYQISKARKMLTPTKNKDK